MWCSGKESFWFLVWNIIRNFREPRLLDGHLVNCISSKFPGDSNGRESACNAGDLGSIPRLGRSPGEGNGYPLQYSCVENLMVRGAWQATVHGATRVRYDWAINTNLTNWRIVHKLPMIINTISKLCELLNRQSFYHMNYWHAWGLVIARITEPLIYQVRW